MTKKEAIQILAILKAAYPASYNGMTKEEASGTVTVWSMQFADMPVDIVMMAIQKLISTSKFPPTVADVKDKIRGIHWEAYTEMIDGMRYKTITEEEQKYYQRICDVTTDFTGRGSFEPSITQMLNSGYRPQIGRCAHRLWCNNATNYYMAADGSAIHVNGTRVNTGNHIISGMYLTKDPI